MAKTAILAVKIIGDASDAKKAFGETESGVSKLESSLGKMVGPATIAFGAVAGGATIATKAAIEQEDQIGALAAVYGPLTKQMEDNAAAASEIGISTADYARQAALLGNSLVGLGSTQEEAAAQSDALINAGAALAAQFGGSSTDAVDSITAAFRGEYDSIQRLIPGINAAAVEQQALTETGKESAKQLTDQEKAAATYSLLMEGSANSIKEFSNQQNSAAFQTQSAKAAMTDASAALGEALIPAVKVGTDVIKKMSSWIKDNSALVSGLAIAIGILAVGILAANAAIKIYNVTMKIMRGIKVAWQVINIAVAVTEWAVLAPILLIVAGIAALIAIIIIVVKNWDDLIAVLKDAYNWLQNKIKAAFDAVSNAISNVVGWLKDAWDWVQKLIGSGLDKIASIIPGGKSTLAITHTNIAPRGLGVTPMASTSGGIVINFNGPTGDPHAISSELRRLFRDDQSRLGRIDVIR